MRRQLLLIRVVHRYPQKVLVAGDQRRPRAAGRQIHHVRDAAILKKNGFQRLSAVFNLSITSVNYCEHECVAHSRKNNSLKALETRSLVIAKTSRQ